MSTSMANRLLHCFTWPQGVSYGQYIRLSTPWALRLSCYGMRSEEWRDDASVDLHMSNGAES